MRALLAAVADGLDWSEVFGTSVAVTTAAGLILALGRLAIWSQWQLVKHESERNVALEKRLDEEVEQTVEWRKEAFAREAELRALYDESMKAHRHCEATLAEHRIEAAREMAELKAQVAELERIVHRPHRRTDDSADDPDDGG